ncbi:zf-HC2 domain-containing protein [Bacillus safensis]
MSCYLIEELLPLYIEGDTSAETNKFVAEHLQSCEKLPTPLSRNERANILYTNP